MAAPPSYENWSREDLIARLKLLEETSTSKPRTSAKTDNAFDFAAHPRRKIALKFCYSGWEYGGLAFQEGHTVLPTVENVLFDALARIKLVDAAKGFEGCGWERCGRTDRGVSSGGQVVSLWVRSALEYPNGPSFLPPERRAVGASSHSNEPLDTPTADDDSSSVHDTNVTSSSAFAVSSKQRQELQYVAMLNRVLPMTIRILAWSPVPPDFSSRFACKYRHYKYFFTSHGLDIDRMREGARRLFGEHDFRNLCKLDPAKQITSFKRKILRAEISEVDGRPSDQEDGSEVLYVFDLIGTAFLYNQVRHIVAVLFMIGTGLEHPSVMTALVNVDVDNPYPPFEGDDPVPEIVDTKPEYQMADPLPLMLWECAYDDKDVSWRVTNGTDVEEGRSGSPGGSTNLVHQLQSVYTRSRIFAALNAQFLTAAQRYVPPPPSLLPLNRTGAIPAPGSLLDIPVGGGVYRHTTKYVPLLQRNRLESVDVVNQRWKEGKGLRRAARKPTVESNCDE